MPLCDARLCLGRQHDSRQSPLAGIENPYTTLGKEANTCGTVNEQCASSWTGGHTDLLSPALPRCWEAECEQLPWPGSQGPRRSPPMFMPQEQ